MALSMVPKALLTLPDLWQSQSTMQRGTVTASFQWTGTPAGKAQRHHTMLWVLDPHIFLIPVFNEDMHWHTDLWINFFPQETLQFKYDCAATSEYPLPLILTLFPLQSTPHHVLGTDMLCNTALYPFHSFYFT